MSEYSAIHEHTQKAAQAQKDDIQHSQIFSGVWNPGKDVYLGPSSTSTCARNSTGTRMEKSKSNNSLHLHLIWIVWNMKTRRISLKAALQSGQAYVFISSGTRNKMQKLH